MNGRPETFPPCQAAVKYLPSDFPEEKGATCVLEMLQDDGVEASVTWRRRDTSTFLVTTLSKCRSAPMSLDNRDEYVYAQQCYPPRTAAAATPHQ